MFINLFVLQVSSSVQLKRRKGKIEEKYLNKLVNNIFLKVMLEVSNYILNFGY